MFSKEWEELKSEGSGHYKVEGVEPMDLYRSGGILWDLAIGSIIGYAFRNREENPRAPRDVIKDMTKIIHFAKMIYVIAKEEIDEEAERKK